MKITFSGRVSVKKSMVFEPLFKPGLRATYREKCELFRDPFSRIYMLVDGQLAGETYARWLPDMADDDELRSLGYIKKYPRWRTIYCYSNAILPEFQGRGLGKILKAFALGEWSYSADYVIGHAAPGASRALNEFFGAAMLHDEPDWCGTGDTYTFYEIECRKISS